MNKRISEIKARVDAASESPLEDISFIANARTDIPYLLEANDKQQKVIDDLTEAMGRVTGTLFHMCQPDKGDIFSKCDDIMVAAIKAAKGGPND